MHVLKRVNTYLDYTARSLNDVAQVVLEVLMNIPPLENQGRWYRPAGNKHVVTGMERRVGFTLEMVKKRSTRTHS